MHAVLIAAAAALLVVAGCSTTPEDQTAASVEERKPASAARPGSAVAVERPHMPSVDVSKPQDKPAGAPTGTLAKRTIFFAYDQFAVADEYRPLIETHARHLRSNPRSRMMIQGSADERGSREYNVALGQRRAESVKKMLMLFGAAESQIEAVSLGEEKPLCRDHLENCWSKNRRGDILYGGEY
jgi:peptidoglycan-associated lipoprotein